MLKLGISPSTDTCSPTRPATNPCCLERSDVLARLGFYSGNLKFDQLVSIQQVDIIRHETWTGCFVDTWSGLWRRTRASVVRILQTQSSALQETRKVPTLPGIS